MKVLDTRKGNYQKQLDYIVENAFNNLLVTTSQDIHRVAQDIVDRLSQNNISYQRVLDRYKDTERIFIYLNEKDKITVQPTNWPKLGLNRISCV